MYRAASERKRVRCACSLPYAYATIVCVCVCVCVRVCVSFQELCWHVGAHIVDGHRCLTVHEQLLFQIPGPVRL